MEKKIKQKLGSEVQFKAKPLHQSARVGWLQLTQNLHPPARPFLSPTLTESRILRAKSFRTEKKVCKLKFCDTNVCKFIFSDKKSVKITLMTTP